MKASFASPYLHLGALTAATLITVVYYLALPPKSTTHRKKPLRSKLPSDLITWRISDPTVDIEVYRAIWNELIPLFAQHGLNLWKANWGFQQQPDGLANADGYLYLSAKVINNTSLARVKQFNGNNGLSHAARYTRPGAVHDCVLRVITVRGQGHDHLRIIRRLSLPPDALLSSNHVLPMINELVFEDIVIGVFPRLIYHLGEATDISKMNSVEDVLYMFLQAFEGIAYLHKNLIAHRDLFFENFLVEWLPQSLSERSSMTRPRVYIIDFENAVEFSEDSVKSDRRCVGTPFPREIYGRPIPPELELAESYCPFRMDIWQFGTDLLEQSLTGLEEVDQLWIDLVSTQPESRPTASEALQRIDNYVRNTPPSFFHISRP
ncbi:hypothetical protein GALMADRAFT_793188 [Galerina marginata CBS 339.88]|uniref:Protein kinase domain-containing protein n=1 Tax=Galerina marginata (strain CBS 339.88) TaxID=685588 RepID=A0A067SL23_GALM3|nr:hypothetical protein GALMADRAFT_793188 [Galerina marginata CBS 339.88]